MSDTGSAAIKEGITSVAGITFFFTRPHTLQSFDQQRFNAYLKRLFQGEIVNYSEQRAAWHTEFRNPTPCQLVQESLNQIQHLSNLIRKKQFHFNVHDVVNIGIGGSDLGSKLICQAFSDEIIEHNVHFVSNLDCAQLKAILKKCSPSNTLFIVTSKSFRTLETLENMIIAKQWLIDNQLDPAQHIIAVTHALAVANEIHQIPKAHILSIPEWMGGRYSVWSAVGLICAIAFGFEKWVALHQGAYEMDQHFRDTMFSENNIIHYAGMLRDVLLRQQINAVVVLPYSYRLRTLPDYLQQLFMESLGKHVTNEGVAVSYPTGPFVFGGTGTSSQHSFQQLMMQGTSAPFADFILPLQQGNIAANCIAQIKTLRDGVSSNDPRKTIMGGKIANLFVLEKLDFKTLGALLSFYEHAVVTLAYMLNVNPFDQFGVEHAKSESAKLWEQHGCCILDIENIRAMLAQ